MVKLSHPELIERLRAMEVIDLLYCLVEAKTGHHVDILSKIPAKVVLQAETALKQLISYSKIADKE